MTLLNRYYEVPPTAGLPIHWRDWLPNNKNLPQQISRLFNLPPLQLTCSGTAALVIALKTLANDNPQRTRVIIPAYTCPLVPIAIHACGLEVELCDLSPNSFDFDFTQLATLMNDSVLAVISTDLGGQTADVQQVKRLAKPYNVAVIEDAAQALGANVGQYSDIIFFSLAAGKGLTLYEGGLLTANDAGLRHQLLQTARSLLPFNPFWELRRTIELLGYTALYNPAGLHFAYGQSRRKLLSQNRLIDAVGDYFDFNLPLHKVSRFRQNVAANACSRLPAFIAETRTQALRRIEKLRKIEGVHLVTGSDESINSWPFLMMVLPSKQIRDAILNELWREPVGVSRLFIHALPDYQYLNDIVPQVSVPNAQNFADRMLTISNSLWLEDRQFDFICQTIQNHL